MHDYQTKKSLDALCGGEREGGGVGQNTSVSLPGLG